MGGIEREKREQMKRKKKGPRSWDVEGENENKNDR
jgi:hypothetical protein